MSWVILFLLIAFEIWMLNDAIKKRMGLFWYIVILFPIGALVYFLIHKIRDFNFSSSGTGLPCYSCRFKVSIYEDRIKCGYPNPPILKTYVNASYCMDYQRR